jgi:quinol monooxygenase YgiN
LKAAQEGNMNANHLLILGVAVLMSFQSGRVLAADITGPYVSIAELEVDPAQLESFKAAAKEVGETSVRVEPGCLVLYAVSEKENPGRVIVFEIYRDGAAYKKHVQTPHFKKFRATTDNMVKSRKLIDTLPISLAVKSPHRSH